MHIYCTYKCIHISLPFDYLNLGFIRFDIDSNNRNKDHLFIYHIRSTNLGVRYVVHIIDFCK